MVVSGSWSAPAPSSAGASDIRIIRCDRRSVVSRAYATSPLRLLTPGNHGHAAWIYTSSLGGGLVDGDAITMQVDVADGASALLATQASTKVYRSPRGTSVDLRANVGEGGTLIALPDPVVCFTGSRYRQQQRFDIASTAGLVVVDSLTSGRHGSGERWAFDEYVARLIVRIDGTLVAHDSMALRRDDGTLSDRLGRFDVLATVVIAGEPFSSAAERVVAQTTNVPVTRRADCLIAATALGSNGCFVRIAGTSLEDVVCTIRGLLSFVPAALGDNPWTRKW
jgi:urease accessory protein